MKITELGAYDGIPAADYHGDLLTPEPALSSSGARRLLATCPAKFWYERNNPKADTEALHIGRCAHEWLLEREAWAERHVVLPEDHNGRTKVGQARLAEIAEAGKTSLRFEQFEMIKAMAEALDAHPIARKCFANCRTEVSGFWIDERWGIWRRVRFDALPNDGRIIGDYKTCASAADADLRAAITRYGYHMNAAWYREAASALGQIENAGFVLVFQEKDPPYLCRPVVIDDEDIGWGNLENWRACEVFARCLRNNHWPGYTDTASKLGLTKWGRRQREDADERGLFQLSYDAQKPLEAAE